MNDNETGAGSALLTTPTLTFTVRERVGWVRFARPEIRNPLDLALRKDLMSVLDLVRDDPEIRVVVIAGTPGAFSAGGNLNEIKEKSVAGPAYWQQRLQVGLRLINDLLHLSRPVITVVDGPAYGAGFAFALAADMVLASPKAKFCMSYLKLGLAPDVGALYLLPRIVGQQRAKELILSTRVVDADEAHRLGIVMEVHPSETIEQRAHRIAVSMTHAARAAVALTKAALNASLDSDQSTMFSLEAASQAAAFSDPEAHQAIDAMQGKRPPPYQWPVDSPKS
jgi:2-(1,2-epoxy-1,2-dihydrophenyl)acetyl-CoA isomerase